MSINACVQIDCSEAGTDEESSTFTSNHCTITRGHGKPDGGTQAFEHGPLPMTNCQLFSVHIGKQNLSRLYILYT